MTRMTKYTRGYVPEHNGYPTDAYVRGSWDDVEFAFVIGAITFERYCELMADREWEE
ncbi:hypothetical protein BJD55_gp059 [Gordonia phage Yvonnetastic]|uniref:Uncharacterized protein n=1 Tax=Gordonia phage Yvonnetastic TaxID=1821566 RepID=A0A142K9C4_9CAUD|nr:hypothetical protein BJD55_gp059 [Gordonia phage Yvonnetastic]AMS02707.1 hypothetical protein SEA_YVONNETASTIC_163 [Gordonia phage Yvonnetastic]WKW86141.1 hypothetical protein SEA_JONJAMES_168 [Gordonia Phage JonJames]